MRGVSPVPDYRVPHTQIGRNGETRYRQLLQLPVVQVFSHHRIELARRYLYRKYQ